MNNQCNNGQADVDKFFIPASIIIAPNSLGYYLRHYSGKSKTYALVHNGNYTTGARGEHRR